MVLCVKGVTRMADAQVQRSKIAHVIRWLALPIILGWIALTVVTSIAVPSLEEVGQAHTVSMNAHDAPSFIAMKRVGVDFEEFDSDANAMIVLEGEQAPRG
jgi:putative drug exporter of the RND superfamily